MLLYHKRYTSSNVHFHLAAQRNEECCQTTLSVSFTVMWKLTVGLRQDVSNCWLFSSLKICSQHTNSKRQQGHWDTYANCSQSGWCEVLAEVNITSKIVYTFKNDQSLLDHIWNRQMFVGIHGIWLYKTLEACLHLNLTSIMRSTTL